MPSLYFSWLIIKLRLRVDSSNYRDILLVLKQWMIWVWLNCVSSVIQEVVCPPQNFFKRRAKKKEEKLEEQQPSKYKSILNKDVPRPEPFLGKGEDNQTNCLRRHSWEGYRGIPLRSNFSLWFSYFAYIRVGREVL